MKIVWDDTGEEVENEMTRNFALYMAVKMGRDYLPSDSVTLRVVRKLLAVKIYEGCDGETMQ